MIVPTTQDLERAVRAYVAAGSGLEPRQVRRGNQRGAVPDSLFASVLLIHNAIQGIPATASRLTGDGLSLAVETLATVEDRYSPSSGSGKEPGTQPGGSRCGPTHSRGFRVL